ncbi:A disintegrin and metalloproteinase with thrombospondin motifs gon-1 isoform X2 [Cimex lectularius]|uniref:A disintegrin and metalloproteinase with thrombospondin motifs 9 n=1 Tax=Cimex lectularius TaxID=79782 RepID=A0A8I6RCD2_CIMLE|nr:A disintegrin and metalloproteinase with thrombospondin motifs gon-1 isoform X2 [Cimex lectularius]
MRSSRIGALLGTVTIALILLTVVFLTSIFLGRQEILHDSNGTKRTNLPTKHEVEYVKPLKMRLPLHERDVLYPEEDSKQQGTIHHSGHFRERMAEIWDPHPEYEFTGFGKHFHLQLAQSQEPFVVPGIKVLHVWENVTVVEEPKLRPEGCFYSGRVKDDPNSLVTVNLCHGMTGHIRTSNESYLIEPAEPWKDHSTPIKHILQKLPFPKTPFPSASNGGFSRRKRSLSKEYYVELMVVADREMVNYHGSAVESYILNLMSIAAMIFKDASIGNHVSIAVVKLVNLKEMDFSKRLPHENGISASTMLRNFCEWQSNHNSPDDNSARHHDSALLLTRENICRDHLHQPDKCDTLGLAELGTMCEPSSCALVRDIGLSAGFTIAHELGHVLNMPHDDDSKCAPYKEKRKAKSFVMSRMLDQDTYPWAWSNCSRHFLTEFLDAGSGDCLLDSPAEDKLPERFGAEGQFPGEVFNENKQCELVFGKSSKICSFMPVCKRLWCTSELGNQSQGCKSLHLPWADGTPCGEHQWCQRGHCIPRNRESLYPIDGGWGPWQGFGECSRTCGGGVRRSIRHCNNPPPANGGHYCVGQRTRYQSCSTQECPEGTQDFREQQCAEYNNNNFKIQGLAKDVKWLPKYGGISPEDRCKLYCRVSQSSSYYLLKDKVIDGTVCDPDTSDICVNGACHPAGCDHELNSTTDLDYCGQCGGNNSSCEQKVGTYNEPKYGYQPVVRIPAGSSNIEIRQYSNNDDRHDDNYLALVDVDTKKYILNGHFVVSHHKRILYGGTTIEYSGADSIIERVNASRPLTKDLIVEVLSVVGIVPPQIKYAYTVQKSINKYTWELAEDWTHCDKVCHGRRWRDYRCVKVKNGEEVAKELCDHINRPKRMESACNTNCHLEWEITMRSECSSHCGSGERTLSFKCVKIHRDEYGDTHKSYQYENVCGHLSKPRETEYCEGPCDSTGWGYGPWSPCSQTCGQGIKTRKATCVDEANRERDERECDHLLKPNIEEACQIKPCPSWEEKEWSECSQTCGRGKRRKPYSCKVGRKDVNSSLCEGPPPVKEEECNLQPCPQWREIGEWSQCSTTCGLGDQSIRIECTVPNGCGNLQKPPTTRSCNLTPCSFPQENAVPDDTSSSSPYTWTTHVGKCIPQCGKGKKELYKCYDNYKNIFVSSNLCLKYHDTRTTSEECFTPCSGKWRVKNWKPCSAICGKGIERRHVYCVGENEEEVPHSFCQSDTMPNDRRNCSKYCYKDRGWLVEHWSQCSVSCGVGIKMRNVICPETSQFCSSPRPEERASCDAGPCLEEGEWVEVNRLPCNVTCGHGFSKVEYQCKSHFGDILPERACRQNKPNHLEPCYNEDCVSIDVKAKWKMSKWSQCSRDSCTKSRTILHCVIRESVVGEKHCAHLGKPKLKRPCKRMCHQNDHVWRRGKWSECSATCGPGIRTRTVVCVKKGRHKKSQRENELDETKENHCVNPKPATKEHCNTNCGGMTNRQTLSWVALPWQPCTNTCSPPRQQKREVKCFNGTRKVSKARCRNLPEPVKVRNCDVICSSCKELFNAIGSHFMKDGYYTIYPVDHKNKLKVYCDTSHGYPKEYIDLDYRHNLAINFDPVVKKPHTCPKQTICHNNKLARNMFKPGYTIFNKIALNVNTMTVNRSDWTFARTIQGSPVRYGEAAGLQGYFRINLRNTGLILSPDNNWVSSTGTKMEISISDDNTIVEVNCGGCCSHCWPSNELKLVLAPP